VQVAQLICGHRPVVEVENQTQVVVNGWHHSGSYDFATGKEI